MPEIGGRKLAGEFGNMIADVRKMIDEAKIGLAGAVTEIVTELKGAKQIERQLRDEAASVRKAFGEVLGNNPPQVPADELKKTEPGYTPPGGAANQRPFPSSADASASGKDA